MDLRPLTYEEMCQMELLQTGLTQINTSNSMGINNGQTMTATVSAPHQTTLMPIMVIPTTLMTTQAKQCDDNEQQSLQQPTHFYQLQPTHILAATAAPASVNTSNANTLDYTLNNKPTVSAAAATALILQPTITAAAAANEHNSQQIPQQQTQQQHPTINFVYTTGTLKPQTTKHQLQQSLLTRSNIECATLPRNFQPGLQLTNPPSQKQLLHLQQQQQQQQQLDESDFEGSECNASISTTTCIPHFRFGGCGVILQPATQTHTQQHMQQNSTMHQHQPRQQQQEQVIGCASLSHMMGTFASAANDAMHTVGGRNFTGTLNRNRRNQNESTATDANSSATAAAGVTQQTPKRVSFKGVDLPPPSPEELQMLDGGGVGIIGQHFEPFNNCSYVHFDQFTDYQTTGFGGLPDVTEHSNIRRNLSRQNSTSNSDSGGEIASIQKTKVNFSDLKHPASLDSPDNALDVHSLKHKSATQSGSIKRGKGGGSFKGDPHNRHSSASQSASSSALGNVQHKMTGRGSCVIGLTLVVALVLLAVAATLLYQHFVMSPNRNSHTQRLKIVKRILRDVPLVDGHNNFAWNVRKYGHSSLELVHIKNEQTNHKAMWERPPWAQTDMKRLKLGQVGVQVWSAFVPCIAQGLDAVQLALEQIDIIRRLTDMYHQDTVLVQSSADIHKAQRQGLMASLIGIEGGHAIGSSLAVLRSFYSLGARYLSLTHKCDVSWAGSSSNAVDSGLTQYGKSVVKEMNRLGMMIDLSYSSDATARDVLKETRAPVIFSHSGARQLCNSSRNIPDDILRLLAENGGLIMISFDSEDVACGRQALLKDVVEHINYIRAIAGVQHIGLGAGYDGIELPPVGLEDVSKYPDLLATLLEDSNWSEEDVAMLAGKNFLRIMETVENVRDFWKRAAILPLELTEGKQAKSQCSYMSS